MAWDPHKGAKAAAELEAATADVAREVAALLAENARMREVLAACQDFLCDGANHKDEREALKARVDALLPPGPGPSF